MTDDRKGGIVLIATAMAFILIMLLHPTGHDLFAPGKLESASLLGAVVHAVAIASLPLSFLGVLALTRRVSSPDRYAVTALVVYGFALVAVMIAAAMSGFVAPGLVRDVIESGSASDGVSHALLDYTAHTNQAFARVFAVGSSVAIALWSCAIAANRRLALGAAIYGLVLGPVVVLAIVSGHVRLDVHGMGMVVLGQSIWFIAVGTSMCRRAPR